MGQLTPGRPRDRTGRPLPWGAPDESAPAPAAFVSTRDTLAAAQRLLDSGRPFAAHEVLEQAWKAPGAAEEDRPLWRALAQLAVALTHRQRHNAAGETALLDRCAAVLCSGARLRDAPERDLAGAVLAARRGERVVL